MGIFTIMGISNIIYNGDIPIFQYHHYDRLTDRQIVKRRWSKSLQCLVVPAVVYREVWAKSAGFDEI
jgi:hypothetical protein